MTSKERSALTLALHYDQVLDGTALSTSRTTRLAVARTLEARGLLRETAGYVVDGDGFVLQPERWSRCFALTVQGRKLARRLVAEDEAEHRALVVAGGGE